MRKRILAYIFAKCPTYNAHQIFLVWLGNEIQTLKKSANSKYVIIHVANSDRSPHRLMTLGT
jgi:hypothetical protein